MLTQQVRQERGKNGISLETSLSAFEQEGENMSTKIESRHKQALRYAMEKISRSPLAPYVNELYLYGSYARGTQTWESDVDLLLTLDGNAPNLKKEIIKLKAEVSQDGIDDVQVDLKVLYGDAWKTSQMLYYQNIRREGKKLW